MNAPVLVGDIAEEVEFFAPTSTTALDSLIAQYQAMRQKIEAVSEYVKGDQAQGAFGYFFKGSKERFERYIPDPAQILTLDAAIPALNADYWSRAMQMTDVYDFMPDKRRQEWRESIDKMTTPEFEEQTVKATMTDLLAKRMDFLAEKVDGIFSGLSDEHLTNQPEGFGKRMIIGNVYSSYSSGANCGLIHDMRGIIAKFMGRDEPRWSATSVILERVRRETGVWHLVDGGAFRIRVYKKGTAHLEVHPQIAYRLNQILAHLHPMAIPSQFRQRPKRKARTEFDLMQRPLPFAVLSALESARFYKAGSIAVHASWDRKEAKWEQNTLALEYGWEEADKHTRKAIIETLEAIGGVQHEMHSSWFVFDYNVKPVIDHILVSGCIPDEKSHQFYPTPEKLARIAVEMAEIGEFDTCLEPSAGQGGLAWFLPADRTDCVEVSPLNCRVLRAREYSAVEADFLQWAQSARKYDCIVMNPPFSHERWRTHLEAAAGLLADGGRLVAILPASAQSKDLLPGCAVQWHGPYDNEFAGTSISVVILVAEQINNTKE